MTVSRALHAQVLERDGECFVHHVDSQHRCRDRWGVAHSPFDLSRLTVDHVNDVSAIMGKRAPDDPYHLVAMCAAANIAGPSATVRQAAREYLAAARSTMTVYVVWMQSTDPNAPTEHLVIQPGTRRTRRPDVEPCCTAAIGSAVERSLDDPLICAEVQHAVITAIREHEHAGAQIKLALVAHRQPLCSVEFMANWRLAPAGTDPPRCPICTRQVELADFLEVISG